MAELVTPLIPPQSPAGFGSPIYKYSPSARVHFLAQDEGEGSPTIPPPAAGRGEEEGEGKRPKRSHLPSLQEVRAHTLRKMIRSALYAGIARLLFGFIKSLVKAGISRKFLQLSKEELFSVNPWKWGILVGSLSSYRGVQQLLERYLRLPAKLSSALAGAVSSLGFLVMNIETRTELALYTSVRAAHGLLTAHVQPNLPWKALREFPHYDTLTMSLTGIQILYCLMFEPGCHLTSYQHFLVRCTTIDPRALATAANLHRGIVCPEMVDLAKEKGLAVLPAVGETCSYVHHHTGSCTLATLQFIWRHMTRFTLPLYVPLKLSTTFVFGYKNAIKAPLASLQKALLSALRSAVFLTAYCLPPTSSMCVFAQLGVANPLLIGVCSGFFSGLATLIEPKGRRLDLALYCCMHAARSLLLLLVRRGYLRRPNRHHVTVLGVLAFGAMFYQYDHECAQLHPNVVKALSWVTAERKKRSPTGEGEGQEGRKKQVEKVQQKELAAAPDDTPLQSRANTGAAAVSSKPMNLMHPPPIDVMGDDEVSLYTATSGHGSQDRLETNSHASTVGTPGGTPSRISAAGSTGTPSTHHRHSSSP